MRFLAVLLLTAGFAGQTALLAGAMRIEDIPPGGTLSFLVAVGPGGRTPPFDGMIRFGIEIASRGTQPVATITLEPDALENINKAEAAWGHCVNVPVRRLLTSTEIRYLDEFLQCYLDEKPVGSNAVPGTYAVREFLWQNKGDPMAKRRLVQANTRLDSELIDQFLGIKW